MKNKLTLALGFTLFSSIALCQTDLIPQEKFETDKLGTLYQANFFSGTTSADWYRRGDNSSATGGNTVLPFTPLGISGNYIAGDDVDETDPNNTENPLGDGEHGYLTFKTIDVSDYSEINVTLKLGASISDEFSTIEEDSNFDGFRIEVAYDTNIANGANTIGGLPTVANLNTGTYAVKALFSSTGLGNGASREGRLGHDADFDGQADPGVVLLSETAQEFTFKIPTNGATLASVRLVISSDQSSEDIFYDDVTIEGENTLGLKNYDKTNKVVIFPNPIKPNKQLHIITNSTIKTIVLCNTLGEEVYKTTINKNNKNLLINLPKSLKQGVYFLKTNTNKGISIKKVSIN